MQAELALNGQPITREQVIGWLEGKRITLWADWVVAEPGRREIAADWFIEEMQDLSASMAPPKVRTKGKKTKNGTANTRS